MNNDLRIKIVEMITHAGEGHIPSAFSILDIIETLYSKYLKFDPKNPSWDDRDYFILSKGHGCAALYVVLEKYGLLTQEDLNGYTQYHSILGGHPDRTKVPGVEASTGSLGHGFPMAVGIALAQRIKGKKNQVIALVGDGECHEGTVWESALVAQNLKLDNLCCIIDYNGSAAQLLPHPHFQQQWESFGWRVINADGHDGKEIGSALECFYKEKIMKPTAIIAHTIKGKGVSFLEQHGPWHHKVPNKTEYQAILSELKQ